MEPTGFAVFFIVMCGITILACAPPLTLHLFLGGFGFFEKPPLKERIREQKIKSALLILLSIPLFPVILLTMPMDVLLRDKFSSKDRTPIMKLIRNRPVAASVFFLFGLPILWIQMFTICTLEGPWP